MKAAKLPVLEKETEVDDDENIFSKSGFTGFYEFINKNTLLIGKNNQGRKTDREKERKRNI